MKSLGCFMTGSLHMADHRIPIWAGSIYNPLCNPPNQPGFWWRTFGLYVACPNLWFGGGGHDTIAQKQSETSTMLNTCTKLGSATTKIQRISCHTMNLGSNYRWLLGQLFSLKIPGFWSLLSWPNRSPPPKKKKGHKVKVKKDENFLNFPVEVFVIVVVVELWNRKYQTRRSSACGLSTRVCADQSPPQSQKFPPIGQNPKAKLSSIPIIFQG